MSYGRCPELRNTMEKPKAKKRAPLYEGEFHSRQGPEKRWEESSALLHKLEKLLLKPSTVVIIGYTVAWDAGSTKST